MRCLWDAKSVMSHRGAVSLPVSAVSDIEWWISRLSDVSWPGSRIWYADESMPVHTFKSDASGHIGCGYHRGTLERMYAWGDEERAKSIAWKELFPVVLAAREFASA